MALRCPSCRSALVLFAKGVPARLPCPTCRVDLVIADRQGPPDGLWRTWVVVMPSKGAAAS